MRRVILVFVVGLGLAFGAFYLFSWPATLSGQHGNEVGFGEVKAGERLNAGGMIFDVVGRRDITILTVKLNSPTIGIELESAHIGGGSVGALRGDDPAIDALPRAPGFVLHPNEGGSFVVTFTATTSGSFNGITITYKTGWLSRSVTLGPKVTVTVPGSAIPPSP